LEPHPVTADATVLLTLPEPSPVVLDCYDARGARIWSYRSGGLVAGTHLVRWDGRATGGQRIEAGTYFLRLSAASRSVTRKIVVLPRD
jgi:flagellar hook assembly protein FlgD